MNESMVIILAMYAYSACEDAHEWLVENDFRRGSYYGTKDQDEAFKFETMNTVQQEQVEVIYSK